MFRFKDVWSGNRYYVEVNLDGKLDLKAIALQACNAEYDPKVGLLFRCIFVFIFILQVVLFFQGSISM
jgi:hypothetical protein